MKWQISKSIWLVFWGCFLVLQLNAQTGTLKGIVSDKQTKETIIGASVTIVGTYKGAITDEEGKFEIKDIKPGEYSIRFSYVGYSEVLYNGIKISADKPTVLTVTMQNAEVTMGAVEIVGEKNLLNLESGKSEVKIGADEIKDMNVTDVQSIAALQVGINKTPDGLQIRGGRVYETQYVVDGINAQDPLAGTGFGVDVNSSAVKEVEIMTGGADAEYGDGTSGVVVTRTKDGGKKFSLSGNYARDNFGFNKNQGMSWNTDMLNLSIGGPLIPRFKPTGDRSEENKGIANKLFFFVSGSMMLTDEFMNVTARQLRSSLLSEGDTIWAPRQDNRWSGTMKLTYKIKPGMKLTFS
ncbi:MAG: TonB-dependent receptor, partial [Bacteroidia bacterium]|nr:TonB-dependent receptor [Bacteroidia bacterium]